ncbi:DUF5709 domain-containing protein [Marihabitans asiaticum]|uniref:DUF5709 domain-containing protein n=1 Tax=Marihabitans asiaticum TaxID=415218 RepID=A0A560WHZ0_9MICO|nr:DUF5709 domain-containing protein [Marihabitans asiaticum]TWD17186.1 hypothetical protein FB557_0752 [Marihabitans asiaticum]
MSERGDANLSRGIVDPGQLQPEDTLDGELGSDVLDTGYTADDRPRGDEGWGRVEPDHHDSIEDRIAQEEADPASAYGAPDNESGMDRERIGGDDPDAIDADDDWLGDGEVGDERAGRLVAPDQGDGNDTEDEAWGRDVGVDGGAASAEEASMHVIGERDEDERGEEER